VRLAGDFRTPGHKRWSTEEANLLYVAGTRGMRSLSLDDVLADGLGLGGKSSYREAAPQCAEREQRRESKKPSRSPRSEEVGVGI